jgi:hypothetical protein
MEAVPATAQVGATTLVVGTEGVGFTATVVEAVQAPEEELTDTV